MNQSQYSVFIQDGQNIDEVVFLLEELPDTEVVSVNRMLDYLVVRTLQPHTLWNVKGIAEICDDKPIT